MPRRFKKDLPIQNNGITFIVLEKNILINNEQLKVHQGKTIIVFQSVMNICRALATSMEIGLKNQVRCPLINIE